MTDTEVVTLWRCPCGWVEDAGPGRCPDYKMHPMGDYTAVIIEAELLYADGFVPASELAAAQAERDELSREVGRVWQRERELIEALEDLIDHKNDYPTDLDSGHEYREAFKRAAAVLPSVPDAELAVARTELDEAKAWAEEADTFRRANLDKRLEWHAKYKSSEAVAVQLREALDEMRAHLTEAERLMSVLLAANPHDRDGILEDIALFVESPDSLTSRAVLSGSPLPDTEEEQA